MTIRIKCTTLFDITATGVKHRFHKSRLPFTDQANQEIYDDTTWQHSRNRQCNWETVNQVISLRTLPENITDPICENSIWSFEFDVIDPGSIERDGDPVLMLKEDCNGVPMITGLGEQKIVEPMLVSTVGKENVWFEMLPNLVNTASD